MFPSGVSYADPVELYGSGAACKYSADWKGGITMDGGERAEGTLTEFSVTEAGVLFCTGQDTWCKYTFNGQVLNKEVTIYKQYENKQEIVKLKGSLTTNIL